jgi:hypothetical protein
MRPSGAGTTPAPTQAAAPPAVAAQTARAFVSPASPAPRAPPLAATCPIALSVAARGPWSLA